MMLPRPLRRFKAIRRPGKGSPAVFALCNPGPSLRDFTKNIGVQNKTLCPDKPSLGSQAEGFAKPMSSEPAPSHRPWISALGATPACRALPYHAGLQSYTWRIRFLGKLKVRPCRMRARNSKTTLIYRNGCENAPTEGCRRSTEFVIVVPGSIWRNIFLPKTWRHRKAEKDETTKSFEQQSN
jgi:hypothetical protein